MCNTVNGAGTLKARGFDARQENEVKGWTSPKSRSESIELMKQGAQFDTERRELYREGVRAADVPMKDRRWNGVDN